MSALRQVDEREEAKRRKPKIDPDAEEGVETKAAEPVELPPLEGLAALGYTVLKDRLNESQVIKAKAEASLKQNGEEKLAQQEQLGRLYSQRVHVNVPDFKKVQGTPTVTQALRIRSLVQLQCLVSGAIVDKDWAATFAAVLADLEKAAASATGSSAAVVTETLLDVCRVAWTLNQREVAVKCCELAEKGASSGPSIRVKLDLCKAIAIVANIASESANAVLEQRLAQKQVEGFAASRRIEAIKILERTLTMCLTRLEDDSLSQEICIAIWNTALPLLQPHLRSNVHRAFQLAAGALEAANSPLTLLRSQLHFELAKCEESTDFISNAKEEGERAMACDYGSLDDKLLPTAACDLDRNRSMDHLVSPFVHLLDVRSNVYDAPTDPEGQVLLLIQQMKETSSRAVQRDALGKAMGLMSAALGANGAALEPLPLEEVEAVLLAPRNSDYAVFSMLLQQQVTIMAQLAQLALGLKNIAALQHACRFVLSHRLDPADPFMRPSLDRQIDAHFLLAESLVEQLSGLWLDDEREKLFLQDQDASEEELLDPRSLGTASKYATDDMQRTKRLVLLSLQRGMELAAALKDEYGVQNGVIYFWNLHLHLFRNGLFAQALPELVEFLSKAMAALAALPSASASPATLASSTNPLAPTALDDRLRLQLVEGLSGLHEAQGNFPQAIEASLKAAAGPGSAYLRKRVVEQVSRQTLSSVAAGAAAGGKGGAKPVELPKFDQPFLLVFSALAQAELPPSVLPREQVTPLVDKAAALMDTEVVAMLQQQDWDNLTQETYDQLLEMQAEAWTRITRAKIRAGDVQGSQATAERCMALIAEGMMLDSDKRKLSPRVWRWVSVCERYFSSAILQLIQPEGQDLSLQSELRLAALRHLFLSADYAHRAGKEDLVIAAAVEAWNASIALLDTANSAVRQSLSSLHRQFIDALLKLKGKPEGGDAAAVGPLLQNFYLALIGAFAAGLEWDSALAVVNEAFQSVPAALQKPLWKWRVVVMSKKGKDVMASLSKLKEGDASLQARVYATLARAASAPQQQLDAYRKTVEILKDDMERVDYLLETAQWLGSSGVPRVEIVEVVQAALDAIYEVEEQNMPLKVDDSLDLDSQSTASRSSTRSAEQQAGTKASAGKSAGGGTAGGKRSADRAATAGSKPGSRRGSASGSRAGSRDVFSRLAIGVGADGVPEQLNCKQLEQALRSLSMLAMLESNESTRRDRCTELPYFLRRLLIAWQDTIFEAAKLSAYAKLPLLEREAIPYESFSAPEEALAGLSLPVDKELELLKWQPSDRFMELLALVVAEQPLIVPSLESFCSLPLTLHCLLWAASQLAAFSLPKHALLLLGCLRAVVMCLPLPASEQNAALAMLHFRSLVVATECGLAKEAQTLPNTLGRSSMPCTEFIQSLAAVPVDAQTVRQLESNASEQLSVFGFSSFTSALTGVDPLRCALELAGDLLKMGQLSLCRGLTEGLARDFAIKQWPRERLLARTLLAELDLLQGKFGDALSSLLSCAQVMQACGDSSLIARHTTVVCAAYQRAGQPSEARRVVQDAIEALQTFCFLHVATPADEASSQGLSGSISRGAGSISRGTSRGASKKGGVRAAISPNERSREALLALESCVGLLLSIIIGDAAAAVKAGKDARSFISEAVALCDKLQETAVLVCGSNCLVQARALGAKAATQARVLSLLHASASAATGLRPGQYPQWLLETLQQCIDWQSRAVGIRRGALAQITLSDQTYDIAPPPPAPVAEDPKAAKKGAPPPVAELSAPETLFLSLPIVREAASAEQFLAELHLTLARLKADDVSILPIAPTASSTAVEKFLIETTQPESFAAQDFSLPPTFAAIQLTGSAMALLAPTEPADSDTAAAAAAAVVGSRIESEVLHHAAIIARSSGAGAYNILWPAPAPAPAPAEGENAPDPVPASDAATATERGLPRDLLSSRSRLLSLVGPSLKRASTSTLAAPASVSLGLTALIDSFGKLNQAGQAEISASSASGGCSNAAAVFILALQSVRARDWLLSVWERSVPASSQAAAAFARLQSLELSGAPHPTSLPQMAADVRFLAASCPAWNRLSVAADPSAILGKLGSGVAVFCLTLDHASRSIYVAAGVPAPASASASASFSEWTAQGSWAVERVELDESSRRILQALTQQQRAWVDDCTKFVNIYGESVSQDQDLVGCDGRMGGKLLKTERSLEERLRALVADLETVLSGVLGPESSVARLFSSLGEAAASCVLLLDPTLHTLPVEALAAFSPFAGRVVRDFSVHLLGHRLDAFAPAAAAAAAPAGKGAAPAAAAAAPSLSASAVQALVEPFGDDTGSRIQGFERVSVDDIYAQTVSSVPGAGKWTRVAPVTGTLSLQDLTVALSSPAVPLDPKNPSGPSARRPVGLFVHSTGRLGSMLAPCELAGGVDLRALLLLLVCDQGSCDASYRRQNVLDNAKSPSELSLEEPMAVQALGEFNLPPLLFFVLLFSSSSLYSRLPPFLSLSLFFSLLPFPSLPRHSRARRGGVQRLSAMGHAPAGTGPLRLRSVGCPRSGQGAGGASSCFCLPLRRPSLLWSRPRTG